MTTQKRNDEMVNLLRPDFFARSEPNASMVHYQSAVMSTAGLHGFYPMSAIKDVAGVIYARDTACDYDLTCENTPRFGYTRSTTLVALPPWVDFVAATSQYLTYGADDNQHDITGAETYIYPTVCRGLTIGGWFKFTTVPASIMGLISKWEQTLGNQRAYRLYKNAANNIVFEISTTGADVIAVTSTATVTTGVWYHLFGSFDVSGQNIFVYVDNARNSQATGGAVTVFNSTEPFEIARTDRGNYLDGKTSMCQVNSTYLDWQIIQVLWEQSRVMYNREG